MAVTPVREAVRREAARPEAVPREAPRSPAWLRDPRVRRLRAARVVRLLAPGAQAVGLYPSGELRLALGSVVRRPFVCVAAGDPPADGVLTEAPVLVVEAVGEDVGCYLRAGVGVAWVVGAGHAEIRLPGGSVEPLEAGDSLAVPGWPSLRVPVAAVTAAVDGKTPDGKAPDGKTPDGHEPAGASSAGREVTGAPSAGREVTGASSGAGEVADTPPAGTEAR